MEFMEDMPKVIWDAIRAANEKVTCIEVYKNNGSYTWIDEESHDKTENPGHHLGTIFYENTITEKGELTWPYYSRSQDATAHTIETYAFFKYIEMLEIETECVNT